jgi:hypothetical protein
VGQLASQADSHCWHDFGEKRDRERFTDREAAKHSGDYDRCTFHSVRYCRDRTTRVRRRAHHLGGVNGIALAWVVGHPLRALRLTRHSLRVLQRPGGKFVREALAPSLIGCALIACAVTAHARRMRGRARGTSFLRTRSRALGTSFSGAWQALEIKAVRQVGYAKSRPSRVEHARKFSGIRQHPMARWRTSHPSHGMRRLRVTCPRDRNRSRDLRGRPRRLLPSSHRRGCGTHSAGCWRLVSSPRRRVRLPAAPIAPRSAGGAATPASRRLHRS